MDPDKFDRMFGGFFVAAAVISVVVTGVLVWAVVALVKHIT